MGIYEVKKKKRKSVFHNVPSERREGEEFFGFRDVLIMEHYSQRNSKNDISCFDFRKVVKLYQDVTVTEMIGA